MITFEEIKQNKEINMYITKADETLEAMGYTEHSFAHVTKVAMNASKILEALNMDSHTIELAKIAGYMHDIGNLVNRVDHSQSGALMAYRILDRMDMEKEDVAEIVRAIGNHDEGSGEAVNPLCASIIIADKSDVRRSRVREIDQSKFDIHDRVNYSVYNSNLEINNSEKNIILKLDIDTSISSVMEYVEIFIGRMKLCVKAANSIGYQFKLVINEQVIM